MEENDFDISQFNKIIESLGQKHLKTIKRIKLLTKKINDLKEEEHKTKTRLRILESTGAEKLKEDIYSLENRLKNIETKHDNTKEKWRKIFDFAIQLAWVSMAAWLLTKLGLQPPL